MNIPTLEKGRKKLIGISATIFLILIVSWSILIYYVTPEKIIGSIGINNGYVIIFIAGILGGTSLFFPFPYYLLVLTFAAAGLNPLILALFSAFGVILGECTSYFVGHSTYSLLPESISKKLHKLKHWVVRKPKWLISLILFLWGALAPIPNDLFLVPLGLVRFPFWRTIIPLGAGNLVFNIILAYTGKYGWSLFFG